MIKKYDIYLVNLDPRRGSAQGGTRPCIVVQNTIINENCPTIVVVPVTSQKGKLYPNEFVISPSEVNGLTKDSRFLAGQIVAVDQDGFYEYLGTLETYYAPFVRRALAITLDLDDDFAGEEEL